MPGEVQLFARSDYSCTVTNGALQGLKVDVRVQGRFERLKITLTCIVATTETLVTTRGKKNVDENQK